jgi:hypothetical protein
MHDFLEPLHGRGDAHHVWFELRGDGDGGAVRGRCGRGWACTGLGLGAADAKAPMRDCQED